MRAGVPTAFKDSLNAVLFEPGLGPTLEKERLVAGSERCLSPYLEATPVATTLFVNLAIMRSEIVNDARNDFAC